MVDMEYVEMNPEMKPAVLDVGCTSVSLCLRCCSSNVIIWVKTSWEGTLNFKAREAQLSKKAL